MKKKREYKSSELVQSLAKIYGFEDKLLAFEIKDFLQDYLDHSWFSEIQQVNIKNNIIFLQIHSPLVRNEFTMRKSFFLKKIQEKFGTEKVIDINFF